MRRDIAGFANGRRVADDTLDIELTAVHGILLGVPGIVGPQDEAYLSGFPYLGTPHAGSSHTHDHETPPA